MSTPSPIPRLDSPGGDLLDLLAASVPARLDTEGVHRIRVAIKQTRAWLKLRRGDKQLQLDDRPVVDDLRALSAALAGQRDRDVAVQTLTRLARKYPGHKAQLLTQALCQRLSLWQPPARDIQTVSALCERIRQTLPPFLQQPVPPQVQVDVLHKSHARQCRRGERALASGACCDLHTWRKRVKTLGYQLQMVTVTVVAGGKLFRLLNKLGKKLGDVHDLCFLQAWVEQMVVEDNITLDPAPLYKRIARERKALLAIAHRDFARVCAAPLVLRAD